MTPLVTIETHYLGNCRRWIAAARTMLPLLALLVTVGFGEPVQALDVFYAGLAFRGDAADARKLYPYTLELSKVKTQADARISDLSAALLEAARSVEPPGYDLKIEEKADLKEWKGLSLALAIDRENVTVEKIRNDYKVQYDIGAQILVFDYLEGSIAASFPIAVRLYGFSEGSPPTEEKKAFEFKQLLLDPEGDGRSLVDMFRDALARQPVREHYLSRVGVSKVEVSEAARNFLPEWARGDLAAFEQSLAQIFSKYLSENQLLSVVPYSKEGAIGGTMTAQFVNGDIGEFTLPHPDYVIELNLEGFKKILFDESPSRKKWGYGAYLDVRALFPVSKKEYMNVAFKHGISKKLPLTHDEAEDWPLYYSALEELVAGITDELDEKPDKKWLKSHTNDKNARKQIKKFAEKLEACK